MRNEIDRNKGRKDVHHHEDEHEMDAAGRQKKKREERHTFMITEEGSEIKMGFSLEECGDRKPGMIMWGVKTFPSLCLLEIVHHQQVQFEEMYGMAS